MSTCQLTSDINLSLCQLLDPAVMANPYPLYARLREQDPVHWDPFLKAWVVTRYADAVTVLHSFSAARAPSPEAFSALGCSTLTPIAKLMTKQMMFLDGAAHTRLRSLSAAAFSPQRVLLLRASIQRIVNHLIDQFAERGRMELMADFAEPLPAMVVAEILGVSVTDSKQLKAWSSDFGKMLGSIHHAAEFSSQIIRSVNEATAYFRDAIRAQELEPGDGLVHSLVTAKIDGERLTEEEVIANCILITAGAQEDITNLIGNGMLTLLRHPTAIQQLTSNPAFIQSAVEELLRYESPTQLTMRVAADDVAFEGKLIRKRQLAIVLVAGANRDPNRFTDPDNLDIAREDNRHLAFGWAAHFCLGAPLARMQGQIALNSLLNRLPNLTIESAHVDWRTNLSLRGLQSLPLRFGAFGGSKNSQLTTA